MSGASSSHASADASPPDADDEPRGLFTFDPQAAPVIGAADGVAIPPERLTAQALRDAFGASRPWEPELAETSRQPRLRRGATGLVPASVLVPIVLRPDGPTVLLTERTAHLTDHAGQVSFPGGASEAGDADAVETALRESQEEIGLDRARVEVIGRLPDYPTITGFVVAPIVALVTPPLDLVLYDYEVAEAFEVPLAFLMDPANQQRREATVADTTRRFVAMPHGGHFIWGATASMLRNLYRFLSAQLAT